MNSTDDRILFVDDDDLVLTCFERILGRDFALETASSPAQALDLISNRGPFAVLVSDMRMPGLNGLELIVKAKELSPDIVAILLSGNADIDAGSGTEKNHLIFKVAEKPCPHDILIGILKEALVYHREHRRSS